MPKRDITNRKLAAEKTREKIYKSALSLFRERGYENVTVEEITNDANVAKGTFYIYFKSKDDVLVRTFQEIDKHYIVALEAADNKSAGEQFIVLGNAMCKYVSESFGLDYTKILYRNQISLTEKPIILSNPERPLYKILRSIVEKGKKTGEFRSDILDEDMVLLVSRFMRALLYDWCMHDGKFDLIKEGDRFLKLALSTLRQP